MWQMASRHLLHRGLHRRNTPAQLSPTELPESKEQQRPRAHRCVGNTTFVCSETAALVLRQQDGLCPRTERPVSPRLVTAPSCSAFPSQSATSVPKRREPALLLIDSALVFLRLRKTPADNRLKSVRRGEPIGSGQPCR